MKDGLLIVLLSALFGLYLVVAWLVLHPNVSAEYRAYYIEKSSKDWKNGPHYAAQPEQGVQFGKEGLPTFVRYMYGFGLPQGWGRWTDANQGKKAGIVLNQSFHGFLCLEMELKPATSQVNKQIMVVVGDQTRGIVVDSPRFATYFVDFFEPGKADTIEFRFPQTPPPVFNGRRLGLAIEYLRVFRQSCTTVQQQLRATIPER
jgi:hypothetical protein